MSPVYGDWHGLPPLLIHAGEEELLLEDAARIAEVARAAGVTVRLETYPRMWHVWQNLSVAAAGSRIAGRHCPVPEITSDNGLLNETRYRDRLRIW